MAEYLKYKNRRIPVDREGFLRDIEDWDEEIAEALAATCDIRLQDAHWDVIRAVRRFYREYQLSPPMRPLVKLMQQEFGEEKGRSIYLMKLFGGSPAKTVNKIAGLPRPANCL